MPPLAGCPEPFSPGCLSRISSKVYGTSVSCWEHVDMEAFAGLALVASRAYGVYLHTLIQLQATRRQSVGRTRRSPAVPISPRTLFRWQAQINPFQGLVSEFTFLVRSVNVAQLSQAYPAAPQAERSRSRRARTPERGPKLHQRYSQDADAGIPAPPILRPELTQHDLSQTLAGWW